MLRAVICKLLFALLAAAIVERGFADEPLFPNAGFESGTLEGWTATGTAFNHQPTKGDNPAARNRESSKHDGDYWIGTYEQFNGYDGQPGATQGDGHIGTLTSPEFTIAQPHIKFRIGGGNDPEKLGVQLLVGGTATFLATGFDSETMDEVTADVSAFVGQQARLVIFDQAAGGWGHVNVDNFTATDTAIPDQRGVFAFTDDISPIAYPETGYDQPLRPQFHFTSKRGWINDPNGMVHDGKQYHLFFQHNPKDTVWGNMTWGHATSSDMVHWTQHDHALLPYRVDRRKGTIFSGTAVVDHNNSLGVQVGSVPTLVAFYTYAAGPGFTQSLAYSTDRGETWIYYDEGRPVVENQGFDNGERDPKVFWHEPSKRWVMALWVERKPGRVRWFTSENLTDWTVASDLMRDWAYECMDVVFLPVDGDEANTKCVIYDASFDYEIGAFDGTKFTADSETLKAGGGNFYAAQTFNNSPDGRFVQIGWMSGGPNSADEYGLPFNKQMAFPCELSLRTTPKGIRLFVWPIEEIRTLISHEHVIADTTVADGVNAIADVDSLDLVDLDITFEPGNAKQVVFNLPGTTLTYDVAAGVVRRPDLDKDGDEYQATTIDKLYPRDGVVQLRLLIDRLSVEAFGFGGEIYRSHYIRPSLSSGDISIHPVGGSMKIQSLKLRELESAWQPAKIPTR